MYAPSSTPANDTSINKFRQFIEETAKDISSRICLLIWAYLRVILSVLWTCLVVYVTGRDIMDRLISYDDERPTILLLFQIMYCLVQFMEIGMLSTFIVAGHTKNVKLYRVYYHYCILTLIIYIFAVSMCCLLDRTSAFFIGEMYFTYRYMDIAGIRFNALSFAMIALIDICLELLLIYLIKRLITKYSVVADEKPKACEDV